MQEGSEWYRFAGTDLSFLVWTLLQVLYANLSLSAQQTERVKATLYLFFLWLQRRCQDMQSTLYRVMYILKVEVQLLYT